MSKINFKNIKLNLTSYLKLATKTKIYKLEIALVYEDIIQVIKFNYQNNRNLTERFEKVTKSNARLGQILLGGCRFHQYMFVFIATLIIPLVSTYYEP